MSDVGQPLTPSHEDDKPRSDSIATEDDLKSHEELADMDGSMEEDEQGGDMDDQASETGSPSATTGQKRSSKKETQSSNKKARSAASTGLEIPFRTVKKAMKLDPQFVDIIQTEAAVMATQAAELFLASFARDAYEVAQTRGRNTVRYEDIAEARAKNPALAFLAPLLP